MLDYSTAIYVPVGVEAAFEFFPQMSGPDSFECAQATGGLNIANNASHNHWRSLQDGDGLHNLLLVGLYNCNIVLVVYMVLYFRHLYKTVTFFNSDASHNPCH